MQRLLAKIKALRPRTVRAPLAHRPQIRILCYAPRLEDNGAIIARQIDRCIQITVFRIRWIARDKTGRRPGDVPVMTMSARLGVNPTRRSWRHHQQKPPQPKAAQSPRACRHAS